MAKITRYTGDLQAFASESLGTERTVFGDVTQADDLDSNITSDFFRGWGIVGVNENPTKQDFNALGYTLGQLLSYLHQMGMAEWDGAQEYQIGSFTNRSGAIYRCLTADHVSATAPESDATNWETFPPSASESQQGLVEKATAAESQAFTADKYIDGERLDSALQGANQSLATSGYQIFPGGLILQWGIGDSAGTVSLPTTFPTAGLMGMVCDQDNAPTAVSVTSLTTTQITCDSSEAGGSACNFYAIGY